MLRVAVFWCPVGFVAQLINCYNDVVKDVTLPCFLLNLENFHYNLWHWKILSTILSAKRSSNQFSTTSFLITRQITCFWYANNFQEHELRVYTRNFVPILLLSMLLYSRVYSMAKSIVIRNGKIVWKVVWMEYYLKLNLSSRRNKYPGYFSIVEQSEWSKQMWPTFWSTNTS